MTTTPDKPLCTGIRFPKDLLEQLKVAAADRDVSLNWLVVRLCKESMEKLIPEEDFRLVRD